MKQLLMYVLAGTTVLVGLQSSADIIVRSSHLLEAIPNVSEASTCTVKWYDGPFNFLTAIKPSVRGSFSCVSLDNATKIAGSFSDLNDIVYTKVIPAIVNHMQSKGFIFFKFKTDYPDTTMEFVKE